MGGWYSLYHYILLKRQYYCDSLFLPGSRSIKAVSSLTVLAKSMVWFALYTAPTRIARGLFCLQDPTSLDGYRYALHLPQDDSGRLHDLSTRIVHRVRQRVHDLLDSTLNDLDGTCQAWTSVDALRLSVQVQSAKRQRERIVRIAVKDCRFRPSTADSFPPRFK